MTNPTGWQARGPLECLKLFQRARRSSFLRCNPFRAEP